MTTAQDARGRFTPGNRARAGKGLPPALRGTLSAPVTDAEREAEAVLRRRLQDALRYSPRTAEEVAARATTERRVVEFGRRLFELDEDAWLARKPRFDASARWLEDLEVRLVAGEDGWLPESRPLVPLRRKGRTSEAPPVQPFEFHEPPPPAPIDPLADDPDPELAAAWAGWTKRRDAALDRWRRQNGYAVPVDPLA